LAATKVVVSISAEPSTRTVALWLLAGFLGSFLFIRTSARLMRSPKVPWWPGSVKTSGGLHLHHLVWGIFLLMVAGFLGFVTDPGSPRTEILAAFFGVGAGLTMDEFALWIHLRDVYWAEEGRASVTAAVIVLLLGGLIVLGFAPFDLKNNSSSVDTLLVAVFVDLVLAGLSIVKGKRVLGLIGILFPFASLAGAIRRRVEVVDRLHFVLSTRERHQSHLATEIRRLPTLVDTDSHGHTVTGRSLLGLPLTIELTPPEE
jgi:hypothetical protein